MNKWTTFECPQCHEAFHYEPLPQVSQRLQEMELKLGRACRVIVDCPHCSEVIFVDRDTGRTGKFDAPPADDPGIGGVFWDMAAGEKVKNEVNRLNEEGDRLMSVDTAEAEAVFRMALEISKHNPLSWYNVGVCRHKAGDVVEAEKCYRHALQFNSSMIQAWNNLGTLLAEQQRLKEADECFDRGLEADPNYPKFYLGKSNIAAMSLRFDLARSYLRTALEKDPNYQPAIVGLLKLDLMERSFKNPRQPRTDKGLGRLTLSQRIRRWFNKSSGISE